jgi:hypothetical protein
MLQIIHSLTILNIIAAVVSYNVNSYGNIQAFNLVTLPYAELTHGNESLKWAFYTSRLYATRMIYLLSLLQLHQGYAGLKCNWKEIWHAYRIYVEGTFSKTVNTRQTRVHERITLKCTLKRKCLPNSVFHTAWCNDYDFYFEIWRRRLRIYVRTPTG